MAHEPRDLYEILVPCQWNDGEPVRTKHHREWDRRVRKIAGGLTILRPCKGQWVHEDNLYEDRVIPVRIFCTQDQIEQIGRITIEHYEQEAVMFYQLSNWCMIAYASPEQRKKFTHKRNNIVGEIADAYNRGMEEDDVSAAISEVEWSNPYSD